MSATLAQLLERRTPVAWFESVAIVQGLCATLLDRTGEQASVPELGEILLTPEGHVEVLGDGPAGQPAVHRAGRVLTALTDQQHMPVPLRLLALTAVSPEPSYGSLSELSTALEFFERPDRAKVVAEVYARYEQMPAPAPGAEAPPLPELEEEKPKRAPAAPPWWRRRWAVASGAVGCMLAVVVPVGWWAWDRPAGRWVRAGTTEVSRAVGAAADAAVTAAGSGLQAVRERFGGTPAVAPASEALAEAPAAAGGTRPRRPPTLPSKAVVEKGDGGPLATMPPPPAPWPVAPLAPADPFLVVAVPIEEGGPIYTEADTAVMPPELLRPRLPKSPPAGVRLEDLPRIEVVVSPLGEVESVKLLSAGAGIYPAMMLSAVKTWRFQPAMREGIPVRYRQQLWITR